MDSSIQLDPTGVDTRYMPVVRLWTLRAILRSKAIDAFVGAHRFQDPQVAKFLGFDEETDVDYSLPWALKHLRGQLAELERGTLVAPQDTTLALNLVKLAKRLGLDDLELEILHLTTLQHLHDDFSSALDLAGQLTRAAACRLLADCLGRSTYEVQKALDDSGRLCRSGLLSVDDRSRYPFSMKLDLLNGLAEALTLEHDNLLEMFSRCIKASPRPRLTLDQYAHLKDDAALLRAYLESAAKRPQAGMNVLIHGCPGTGKTEFVRALVAASGSCLLEIPVEDARGEARESEARFGAFRFAQSLLGTAGGHVLLFDEVEDVFCNTWTPDRDAGNTSGIKGWVNQVLESNQVPTFWVTNNLAAMDPAYRRRFDYVLHMDVPPASTRRSIIEYHVGDLQLPSAWRERAARHTELVPAVIERAVKVSSAMCSASPTLDNVEVLTRVMNNTLLALGSARMEEAQDGPAIDYRIELLNADCDLERLREGLRRVGEGRICLYGPPGTGKTAFGRHVADSLGRPLLVRRASDLLSPYLGVAEQNIAQMFEQARQQDAVLLLDEADSLLRDRRGAQRSWEVTQVNEMLTQMESFRGIFIASTNLMDSLDEAAMRRFDARVRLGYLGSAQAQAMFAQLAASLGLAGDEVAHRALAGNKVLTPGDFAAVARLCRLDPPDTAVALARRLTEACAHKEDRCSRSIGFMKAA